MKKDNVYTDTYVRVWKKVRQLLMMQVGHVVFWEETDNTDARAFGQHFCVWFQTLSTSTCIFIYKHTYTYIYTYVYIYIYMWIYIYIYVYVYIYICIYIHLRIHIYLHVYILILIRTHVRSVGNVGLYWIFAPFGDLWPKDCSTDGFIFLQVLDGDVFVMSRVNPQKFIGVVELLRISWGSQVPSLL